MHNQITAAIDGQSVDILRASLSTDMQTPYWTGSITLSPDNYHRLDLQRARGDEPVITLTINNTAWAFIAETVSDHREFIGNSYSLSGRSQTARLSADYYATLSGVVDRALYARQIADQILAGMDYSTAVWDVPDWLISADTYDLSNKTPLAVVQEIAGAAGGYVESDPTAKLLSIHPRWPVAAWQIADREADITVPAGVIVSISGDRKPAARANAVRLHGNSEGKLVYRETEDRSSEASVQASPLYTDDQPMISAGIAILSDTGNHKTETVKMPWSDEANIPLARLGQIWQIGESEPWRGVVRGVSIEVGIDNDAPVVWQTVSIDRYLDQ